jgi:arylsulfatase A-like enzyme
VPLIIHAPTLDEHGVVMDVDYQHVDFGETLADVLGLPQPHDDDGGISVFATVRPERDKEFSIRGLRFVYDNEDDAWHHAEAN